MRWALLLAALAAAACGDSSALAQDLQVSGARTAHVTSASPSGECQVQGGTYQAQLVSGDLSFTIELRNWRGPGTYPATYSDRYGAHFSALTMRSDGDSYAASGGTVTVAADQASGTLATDLDAPGGTKLKVSGRWRCR